MRVLICAIGALALSHHAPVLASATFTPLGFLGASNKFTGVAGLSADGTTVVGYSNNDAFGTNAFVWTAGAGMTALPSLGADAYAYDVSADGSTIVGSGYTGSAYGSFVWSGPAHTLSQYPNPGSQLGPAIAVSDDGLIAVGQAQYQSGNGNEAVRFAGGQAQLLGALPGPGGSSSSVALGISGDGSTIVGDSTSVTGWNTPVTFAVGQAPSPLAIPAGFDGGAAIDASYDGTVIVGVAFSNTGGEGVRWVNGAPMGIGLLPGGSFSSANAVNADGTVIGGTANTATAGEAAVWDTVHGLRTLEDILIAEGVDLTGWQLTSIDGISADGTVVAGSARDPFGNNAGFVATIPAIPTPASLGLMGIAATAGVIPRRRS